LVVDDSLINRSILTKILTSLSYEVLTACDGIEASNMVISQNASYFGCIFMDISMPNMDGYEATRIIRSKGIKTPIIALTANSLSEEKTRADKAGMDCFCTKPLRRDKIIKLLDTLSLPRQPREFSRTDFVF
jgi:CheY-like chemotaxis protein